MKLTPIHMRGKRKSKKDSDKANNNANNKQYGNSNRSIQRNGEGSSPSHQNSNLATSEPTVARGGLSALFAPSSPLKRSRASSPVRSALTEELASRRARAKRTVPFDQRFPLEVIERIFFYSMNFNLPRSSPRFGWMLSSHHTLRDLVFAGFGPQWDLTLTKTRYKRPLREDRKKRTAHSRVVDTAISTSVLSAPWAKMDFLVEAMEVWLRTHKDKRYLHVPVPFTEKTIRELAKYFVCNMDHFDALVKQHPEEHILALSQVGSEPNLAPILSINNLNPSIDEANIPDIFEQGDVAENALAAEKDYRNTGWSSDEDEGEDEDEDEDEDGNHPSNGSASTADNSSNNTPPVSVHVCFAMDQYYFLQSLYQYNGGIFDLQHHESPRLLLSRYWDDHRGDTDRNMELRDLIMLRMSVGTTFLRGPSLWKTRIPEWLLEAGGPYPPSLNRSRKGRQTMRDRLRATFDMLSWVVFAGGRLQKQDGWEVTYHGVQNLLHIDVVATEWDSYEDNEEVVSTCEHRAGKPGEKTIRLQYKVDTLVAGILSLFYVLGVFYHQWPVGAVEDIMDEATRNGEKRSRSYRESQTYRILQRIALLIPPNRKRSPLEKLSPHVGIKF